MRKLILIILVSCGMSAQFVQAQENALERKATLNIKNELIEKALNQLEEAYNVSFYYSVEIINTKQTVNLSGEKTLQKVLDEIFAKQGIDYIAKGNRIILISKSASNNSGEKNFTISGTMTDSTSGETLIGGTITVAGTGTGAVTNSYGFYSLSLPAGKVTIQWRYMGYLTKEEEIVLDRNLTRNVKLSPSNYTTGTAVVIGKRSEPREEIKSTQMSKIDLNMAQIKNVPTIMGERDLIKVLQLMPGVKRGGEGQTGMYVRGGGADQNLVIMDEAVVYNINHLFGFLSVFNNDAIKDVSLIKGGFPANYGGRLSSILDIRMKEGNMEKFTAEGGIGIVSSRLTLEGPLKKNKSSFLISGRRTYIDQVFKAVGIPLPFYFYDLNAKVNYQISPKDRVYVSSYFGNDVLYAGSGGDSSEIVKFDTKIGNFTTTVRWNRIMNEKLFANYTLIHTRFRYHIDGTVGENSLFIGSKIRDIGAKADYGYYHSPSTTIKFGAALTNHHFQPNILSAKGIIEDVLKSRKGKELSTQEAGIYGLVDYKLNERITVNGGLRLSALVSGDALYGGPEPRASASYLINEFQSVKLSYSRMLQYMHLVSNSSVSLPTDLWYPVTKNVKPMNADQVAAGYNRYVEKLKSTITVEGYYKLMRNLIEYREGAVLILNDNYENELINGRGHAYGAEILLQKSVGRLNGWIGYSLSWSTRKFDELNNGKTYYAKYDRRHDLSLVMNYEISKRTTFSSVLVYATGSRYTALIGQYAMPSPDMSDIEIYPIYSEKNAIVLSPAYRWDVNFVIKNKPEKKFRTEWVFGAYNATNRAQPYKVNVNLEEGRYEQVGLFGFIPSIGWNFKF